VKVSRCRLVSLVLRPRLALLLALAATPALATTRMVTSTADSGAGTLRQALLDAVAGDHVAFDPVLLLAKTITLTSAELLVNKNLTFDPSPRVTLSGGHTLRVLHVAGGVTVSVTGLTIRDGSSTLGGGGIYNQGTLTVSGCTISGNSADDFGGGIYNAPGTTLAVSGGTVSGNSAGFSGGGIDNHGMLTVSGAGISGNNAERGGGICNFFSATVSSSTVSNNSADDGGGIYTSGVMTVSGCTLTDNGAGEAGGGICNVGTLAVSGCTISGNVLGPYGRSGGGIFTGGTGSALTVSNSNFSYNSPDSISGPYVDGGGNTFG